MQLHRLLGPAPTQRTWSGHTERNDTESWSFLLVTQKAAVHAAGASFSLQAHELALYASDGAQAGTLHRIQSHVASHRAPL